MFTRKQATIAVCLVGFLMLVAMPLFMMMLTLGGVIDLRLEAANPMRQLRVVLYLLLWLVAVGATVFAAAWAAAVPERAPAAAASTETKKEVEAKPEVVAPLFKRPTTV